MKTIFNGRDIINTPVTIKEIEKYLGKKLPKSYYTKGYWNNNRYAIGKILCEMGIRVKSVGTTIEFEKIKK